MQITTRVAGVLAATASAVAMMGAPAFASVAQGPVIAGNIIGDGNHLTDSGNYVYSPVYDPSNICGIALAHTAPAEASCQGGAAVYVDSYNQSADFGF